jgi:hypothetical protein
VAEAERRHETNGKHPGSGISGSFGTHGRKYSVRLVTDAQGKVVHSADYSAFGSTIVPRGSDDVDVKLSCREQPTTLCSF